MQLIAPTHFRNAKPAEAPVVHSGHEERIAGALEVIRPQHHQANHMVAAAMNGQNSLDLHFLTHTTVERFKAVDVVVCIDPNVLIARLTSEAPEGVPKHPALPAYLATAQVGQFLMPFYGPSH